MPEARHHGAVARTGSAAPERHASRAPHAEGEVGAAGSQPDNPAGRSKAVTTPEPERCGNAGAVEAVENQTTVFHRLHRPLEIAHFAISTFPQRRRLFSLIQTETNTSPCASVGRSGQEQDRRKEASGSVRRRRQPALVSGSSRIGNKSRFQAHSALEINFDFRLISGLENAEHSCWGSDSAIVKRRMAESCGGTGP